MSLRAAFTFLRSAAQNATAMGANASRMIERFGKEAQLPDVRHRLLPIVSGPQDVSAEHAREHLRNLPIPSRTFELGRLHRPLIA